jgi:outer membrane protein assembly factor BamB
MLLRNICGTVVSILVLSWASAQAADNWPVWRGPHHDGRVPDERPAVQWTEESLAWKTPIPGRGHSSPVVDQGRVFVTTGDEAQKSQWVLAFDLQSGRQLWERKLFEGGLDHRNHKRNSQASCTVAADGDKIYVSFLNDNAVWVVALSYQGEEAWRRKVTDYKSHWGYSASPALYEGTVIVAADHIEGGRLAALDRKTGEIRWSTPRPKSHNYPSPVIHHIGKSDQLLLAGCDQFSGYDPATGKELWTSPVTTLECVGAAVVSDGLAFASGGYPKKETVCVKTDGSGEVVWRNEVQSYVPSLLSHDGFLYAVIDSGIAYCWDCRTGAEKWKKRLGGTFNASPILAGENIYASREDGTTFVFQANPEQFELVAENRLGTEVFATPAFVGGRIVIRMAEVVDGKRQEWLCCVKKAPQGGK